MRSTSLVLLALGACDATAPAQPAAPVYWTDAVSARRSAARRAIREVDGTWVVPMPGAGATARLTDVGLTLDGGLTIHLDRWGRGDTADTPRAGAPHLGDCTDDTLPSGECVQRVEYDHDGLTEWWVGLDAAVEQGWTLSRRPDGEGPVWLEVGFDGAVAAAGDRVQDTSGRVWSVGDVRAWDARGRPLPATLRLGVDGARLEVDDAGAEWPITIDPVYSTASATIIGTSGMTFGQSSAFLDLDGDGYDELVISDPYAGSHGGNVWVYAGGPSGPEETPSTRLERPGYYTGLGAIVRNAGDTNGDGYEDLLVSTFNQTYISYNAYLYFGGPDGISPAPDVAWESSSSENGFGSDIAAGDLNGDGYADVAIGAFLDATYGKVYVYFGGASGPSTTADLSWTGPASSYHFGWSVGIPGDVDNDGYDDLFIGTPAGGKVYYFPGRSTGPGAMATTTITGTAEWYYGFGMRVVGAGDVDGDGYPDVAISGGDSYSRGGVRIYRGASTGIINSASTTIGLDATHSYAYQGWSMASAGDVDRDGYDDLLVAVSGEGRAELYRGSASGLLSTATLSLDGAAVAVASGDPDGDGLPDAVVSGYNTLSPDESQAVYYEGDGATLTAATTWQSPFPAESLSNGVSSAGDVNGDGYDDILLGGTDSYDGYGPSSGAMYVYYGTADGMPLEPGTEIRGTVTSGYFGYATAGLGDVDRDGYDDVAVGAIGVGSYTGAVYVFHGAPAGLESTARRTLAGRAYSDQFGFRVARAGDVNADGYADLLVGAVGASSYAGAAYVYLGSASGIGASATTTLPGPASNAELGYGLGSGDYDGDGYSDVLVSAPMETIATGSVRIFRGGASGTSSTASTTIVGEAWNDYFGLAVARTPFDVNCDGYDDVLVGAPYASSSAGAAWLFLGSASGVSSTAASIWRGSGSGRLARSVAAIGDTNGDGCDEIAMYAPDPDGVYGQVDIYRGSPSGPGATPDQSLVGSLVYNGFGYLEFGADVNGDGLADLFVVDGASTLRVYLGYGDEDGDGINYPLDCDDSDPTVGAATDSAWADDDGDGFGDPAEAVPLCPDATGYAENADDCDDGDAGVFPGATDTAGDGVDADCDGTERCYVDADNDGVRPSDSTVASADADCDDAGEALATDPTGDCDDTDASVGAGEILGWADDDGDGHGDPAEVVVGCGGSETAVDTSDDCDDDDASVHPGATESVGDGIDSDCDGAERCYLDADDDGYRAEGGATVASTDVDCADSGEAGAAEADGDCDDANATTHPGAAEVVGDGLDQDCDGGELCLADADADGHTSGATVVSVDTTCDDAGEVAAGAPSDDCDDADPAVYGGAFEVSGDEIDADCDGSEVCFVDGDGDGHRPDTTSTVVSADSSCAGVGEAPASASTDDCDDADPAVYPGAAEIPGDGMDQDCDEDELCFLDADGDGYRPDETSTVASADLACDGPGEAEGAAPSGDCDDDDDAVSPGADEVAGDEIDEDCDSGEVCLVDADNDGYRPDGDATLPSADTSCEGPGEARTSDPDGDCDDAVAGTHPGATEVAGDGIDQDCDGQDLAATGDDTAGGGDKGGCGCTSGGASSWAAALGGLVMLAARRRWGLVREADAGGRRPPRLRGRAAASPENADGGLPPARPVGDPGGESAPRAPHHPQPAANTSSPAAWYASSHAP